MTTEMTTDASRPVTLAHISIKKKPRASASERAIKVYLLEKLR